ncbi:T9SS type A sorting domain-containing protein [Algoriella sp.]|uniref:T9SS type A sorting domain-containing protein n=1 Tax=Algoriella sp. TaxID=1872434 RepID=UPI001B146CFA|nr:T9SS type A sorting domain-containing protein [Algoriella sp.]MBO6213465.1 T9SS type A sorting domain-containing protein [Algoriella sp.]
MKKIFTLLSIAALTSVSFGQQHQVSINNSSVEISTVKASENKATEYVLKQYTSDVSAKQMVACSNAAGVVNHFSRLFDLSAAGINEVFTVKSVSVMGTGQDPDGAVVELSFAEVTGAYTAANITAGLGDGYGSHTYVFGTSEFPDIELLDPQTVAVGKKLAVAVSTTLSSADGAYTGGVFLGNNEDAQTSPSYLGWPGTGCVNETPQDILGLGYKQSMIFHVTGTTESLGIVELGSNKLAVYPNPATTEVNVQLKDAKVANVEVADVTGRVIPVKFSKEGKVDTSKLSAGVYFLRVKDDKGVTRIQKFIKK